MANRSEEGWIQAYQDKGAYWMHDGNILRPHALLTSGKHSNGFFNSRLVIPDTTMLRDAASDLIDIFLESGGNIERVDRVVGPQTGATKLAELISDEIRYRRKRRCEWASPAKVGEGADKRMVFKSSNRMVHPGDYVLPCEDVLTTGGSVELTIDAAESLGGIIMPFVCMLVNRSGLEEVGGKKLLALITRNMPIWSPEVCPLCKSGSEAIPAKDSENWARLNATY